jgi:hypothetical protein
MKQLLKDHMKKLGKRGGRACFDKHGNEHFSKLGKKGAKQRWAKLTKQE